MLGGRGRGAAAAPFPVAACARSPQLQPLSPVAASSILVFFGASILVLPKCPDPKQEVSAMEPTGPGLWRSRSAQCDRAGPFAGLGCRRPGTAGGVGARPSPSGPGGPARRARHLLRRPVRALAAGTAGRAPRLRGEPAAAENGGGLEEPNGAGTPGGGPEPRRTAPGARGSLRAGRRSFQPDSAGSAVGEAPWAAWAWVGLAVGAGVARAHPCPWGSVSPCGSRQL